MTNKSHRQNAGLSKVAPLSGRMGAGGFAVVGGKVHSVPAKSAKALKEAGATAMRNLRAKEAE